MASSVASAPSTNILESLPARPPTPPREALHETDATLESIVHRTLAFDPRLSLQTPPSANSPNCPMTTGSDPSSSRIRKKVEWSAQTDYREAPQFHDSLKPNRSSPLPAPCSASSKPVKGILKPTSSPNPLASSLGGEAGGSSSPLNIIEMLDSSIKQLAGSDRDSKLDAYMMLSRALKASNNLPDRVALQDKMSLFMQFIQRDMTAKTPGGNLDSSLVNHSLTLLATFLHFPAIALTLTTDFGIFIMDHSIRSFEDKATPKDVVRHLMQVVAFQNFSPKVITLDRVGRLVAAVHKIENHLKGKSIVMSRLHIYKRLVKQSRVHMTTHCDWLKDMFTDMLSSVKDIRSQAISLGTEAGFALRSEKQLLRKVTDIFQTTNDTEIYIDFYIKRLQEMIKEKQTSCAVPQIWSVVILFLRCPLDRWQYYGPWLTLVQSAFNMTDSSTKQEANLAWNRYVYLSVSDSKVSPKTIGTLCQPILSQLRRKTSPKQRDEATKLRRVVIGGICSLFYYAFAPGSDRYSPDVIWDVAVKPVVNQLSILDGNPDVLEDGVMQAARLLVGLLDVSTPRIWRQDRIMDSTPVKSDELPAIDSRWIRKNCDKVLECVGPIMQKKFCDLAHKDSLVCRLWQALVTSVKVASAKDIKVSEDTAKFVGCAFGLLSKVVTTATAEADAALLDVDFLPSVSNYIQLLIDGLGILPFTEKRLSMTVPNTFEPVSTPSQRPNRVEKPRGVVRMPLHHLFVMMSAIPTNNTDDDNLTNFFHSIFDPFLKNKNAKGRLDLMKELLHLIPRNALSSAGPWLLTADCAKAFLETQSSNSVAHPIEKMLGPDYREIVSLLERGLTAHPSLATAHWLTLLHAVVTRITSDFGEAGCCLIVVEPLAKTLYDAISSSTERPSRLTSEAATALFNLAKIPRDKQALDAARSKLWGAPTSVSKVGSFESLDALYKLGNHFLSYLYQQHDDTSLTALPFMDSINSFLDKHWAVCGLTPIIKLQAGVGMWIQDDKAILTLSSQSSLSNTVGCHPGDTRNSRFSSTNRSLQVTNMWDHICSNIATLCQAKDMDMTQVETLLIYGLKSRHSTILNRTALVCNVVVKIDDDLTCSESLKSIISSVGSKVDVPLHVGSRTSAGIGTEESLRVRRGEEPSFPGNSSLASSIQNASSIAGSPATASSERPLTRKRRLEMTPEIVRDKPTKRTSTPRLRHDDSQIQFEPIVSSSPLQEESQHLTERQKEVRERQRQTTASYSDAPSTSPPAAFRNLPRSNKTGDAKESDKNAQETTPKQNKSFEDLISSTPTPRRGEFLQLDDLLNDPPSSPPIPRPYPLLSEIRSRSRTGNTMEDWEFSSPPGSPAENQQTEDAELPSAARTEATSPVKSPKSSKKQQRAAENAAKAVTSRPVEKGKLFAPLADVQQEKPLEGVITRARKAHGTPRPEKIAYEKVRSTPRRRSSRQMKLEGKNEDHEETDMGLTLDIPTAMPYSKFEMQVEHVGKSTMQSKLAQTEADGAVKPLELHECITVHTDSTWPSTEKLETTTEDPPLVVPSSPAETVESTASSKSHKKRKRGSKGDHVVNKKRRSTVHVMLKSATPGVKLNSIPAPALETAIDHATGVETRSGLRKRQQRGGSDEIEQARSDSKRQSAPSHKSMDGGDTDEEVLSQLRTESHAATQQTQSQQESSIEAAHDVSVTKLNEAAPDLEMAPKPDESLAKDNEAQPNAKPAMSGGEKTASIIECLRNGLGQLRSVSLTRGEVYEVEDILMDMKRELFEAERRGRQQGRRGRSRTRKSRGQ
ncbi:hypothetical protein EsDP_00005942 [Epichloe bromicola]|uniref:Telomere-associated protein Rif1 N-terminal domain-containing protein n=1 Tax=Epichloe bromicola TaxID=79588 RepID=A0ABQ0CW64_9HYPO